MILYQIESDEKLTETQRLAYQKQRKGVVLWRGGFAILFRR